MTVIDTPALEINHLTKLYDGTHGIRDIDLVVKQGEVFGFLGPNGAGKSTTINTILDLLRADSGQVKILGTKNRRTHKTHRHIGYLSGDMETDPTLTGRQYLTFVAHQQGGVDRKVIDELAKRLKADLSVKIRHLSRGNKQKIGLIAALMHDPDVLILDEPTSGLDPLIQTEFNAIITERRAAGKTTFMSSHVLSEVQETCDRVGFIREGRLVHVGSLRKLLEQTARTVEVRFRNPQFSKQLAKLEGVKHLKHTDGLTSFSFAGDINRLLHIFAAHPVDSLTINEPDLEDLFMGYYRQEDKHA